MNGAGCFCRIMITKQRKKPEVEDSSTIVTQVQGLVLKERKVVPTKAGRLVGPVIIANRLMNYSPRRPDCVTYAILRIRPFQSNREGLVILELVASSITEKDRKKYGFFPGNKFIVREVKSLRFMYSTSNTGGGKV